MAAEAKREIELEIAYVLFIEIVAYSKRVTSEQRRLLELLNQIVRQAEHFQSAEAKHRLLTVPTGDGMALVFYNMPGSNCYPGTTRSAVFRALRALLRHLLPNR